MSHIISWELLIMWTNSMKHNTTTLRVGLTMNPSLHLLVKLYIYYTTLTSSIPYPLLRNIER